MVRSATFAVLLTLGLGMGMSGALAATDSHNSELWHVTPVSEPSTGKFAYCAVESSFDNGFSLGFARNREMNTNLVVTFPDARLTDHTKFRMSLVVDNNPPREFVGFSASTDTLVIPLQHDHTVTDWIGKGKLLELKGPQDAIKFALDGATDALRQMQICVDKGLKAEASRSATPDKASAPAPAAAPAVTIAPETKPQAPVQTASAAPEQKEQQSGEPMIEPLPLPGQQQAHPSVLRQPVVDVTVPAAPSAAEVTAAPQPSVAAPAPNPAPDDEAKIEQEDEVAARAAAARLTQAREAAEKAKVEAAKEDAAKAAELAQQQEAAEQAKADAAKAEAARQEQIAQQRQAAQDAAARLEARAAALAKQKEDAEQAAKAEQAKAPVQPQPPAPAPTVAQAPRPAVTPVPMAPLASSGASSGPVGSLADLLRQSGLAATAIKGEGSAYSFKTGLIAGEAIETKSKKPFLDAVLDNVDSLEKGCHGQFSANLGAPSQKGDLTYSTVATNCAGISGIVLYYEKSGRFGMIAQESTPDQKETAALLRQGMIARLATATNYK